jgi:hypothetical protein
MLFRQVFSVSCAPRSAFVALALSCAVTFVACGGDDSTSTTPSATAAPTSTGQQTATARPTQSPAPTVQPTARALSADSPEVKAVLAMDGFTDFAHAFEIAVGNNDTQFFIDRGQTHSEVCTGGGMGGIPCPTGQTGVPVDVIFVGAWNSEGDYYTKDQYDALITSDLSAANSPKETLYAVGHERRFPGESDAGVDIVVTGIGGPPPSPQQPDLRTALNFRVQQVDGVWRITAVDRAAVSLVPDFFDWYSVWGGLFPLNGG